MKISSKTLVCASLAKSGRTSNAPYMHNVGFRHLDLDYAYVSFEPDNIKDGISAVRSLKIPGGSISVPYKETVLKNLDAINPIAQEIGAVNAFVNDNGKITGHNTDWAGAIHAIEEKSLLNGKHATVLGAGGVARAIVFGLLKRGATVTIFNRTQSRGQQLANDMECTFGGSLDEVNNHTTDILVNATSIGKNNDESHSINATVFKSAELALDVVSWPLKTTFLTEAENYGCSIVGGLRMSVLQAALTFKLITGHDAPIDAMYEAALTQLQK